MDARLNNDADWEAWGRQDPYFAVLTDPRFRNAMLDEVSRHAFFESGRTHAGRVFAALAKLGGVGNVEPERILDFGCGVGRVAIAFAETAREVVGTDVSPAMLEEARRNCEALGRRNVLLLQTDDSLANVTASFDLVHSSIVLQHIEVARGRAIFERLVSLVSPGGFGALHVTFAWLHYAPLFGQPPLAQATARTVGSRRSLWRKLGIGSNVTARKDKAGAPQSSQPSDPRMAMYYYNLSELLFVLHRQGITELNIEITNHDGALGSFLYFRRPTSGSASDLQPGAG